MPAEPLTGKFRKSYTTKSGGGLTYDYDGFWFVAENIVAWRARWSRGKLAGALYGRLQKASSFTAARTIGDEVIKRIGLALEELGDHG